MSLAATSFYATHRTLFAIITDRPANNALIFAKFRLRTIKCCVCPSLSCYFVHALFSLETQSVLYGAGVVET